MIAANTSSANPSDLEALARVRFPDLKPAEVKLVQSAPKGEFTICGPSRNPADPSNDPADATEWGTEREIRADLIRWICVDRQARDLVDPKGIQVGAAKITGSLDLGNVTARFPLRLQNCRLIENADLQRLEIPELDLQGTWARSMSVEGARVRGNVFLRNGFRAEGDVRLVGAQIGGDLSCIGSTFISPPKQWANGSGKALSAEGIDVKGSVYMRSGFRAEGEVSLWGAQIGVNLDCGGGIFTNPPKKGLNASGTALNADRIDVKRDVLLRNGFHAEGEVRLLGAQIGGNLDCGGGTFTNPPKGGLAASGQALSADGVDVRGGVFLCAGFRAEGQVRLPRAKIEKNLECYNGTFVNPPTKRLDSSGLALFAIGMEVNGGLFLRGGFHAEGEVRLLGAKIRGDLDCEKGTFTNPPKAGLAASGHALSADSIDVDGSVYLRYGFRAEGDVRLVGAQIGGDLSCIGGGFINPQEGGLAASGDAVVAGLIIVKGSVYLRDGFYAEGELLLLGAKIEGNLECDNGTFMNPPRIGLDATGRALSADRAVIEGAVSLRNGFRAEGEVRLLGTKIGGGLDCDNGTFMNPPKVGLVASGVALAADTAVIRGGVFLRNGFRADGEVRLAGAQIEGNLYCSKATFHGGVIAVGTVVKGPLIWRSIVDPGQARLTLTNASVNGLIDDPESWPAKGNLFINGFVYGQILDGPKNATIRNKWLELQVPFSPQPYRQLAKVLSEEGDEDGARVVLVEMERRQRETSWAAEVWSGTLRWTIGYGYRSWQALGWDVGLTALGWFFYRRAELAHNIAPKSKDDLNWYKDHGIPPPHLDRFSPLIYSLENSLPLVKLGQADHWQPAPRYRSGQPASSDWRARLRFWREGFTRWVRAGNRWARFVRWTKSPGFLWGFLWVQILLGWILATLFVAGVTGIVHAK